MASFVGLDLGAVQARVLHVEAAGKKFRLKGYRAVDLAPPQSGPVSTYLEKEAGERIGKAFAEAKIPREPVAMSWDSGLTIFRELDVPFTGRDQIQKVIKFEAEGHLLNCDIEDVVVAWYKLAEAREKSHLMVMAVRKDPLRNRLDVLSRAGIDPLVVDLDVMAAFNALNVLGYTSEHESMLVLDCGRRTTNLLLVIDGKLVSGRAIRLGVDSVTARLATDLETDPAELATRQRALLAAPAGGGGDDLIVPASRLLPSEREETEKDARELAHDLAVQRVDDYCERVAREVRRSLLGARAPSDLEVVYATGPGSLLPGFADRIAERIGVSVPVKPLALLDRVEHSFPAAEAEAIGVEITTAFGLAAKLAGHDATGIDFRQEELRYARRFDQIKEPLLYFCGFLLFLVLLANVYRVVQISVKTPFFKDEKHANLTRLHDVAREQFEMALGAEAELPPAMVAPSVRSMNYMLSRLNQRIDALKAELGRGGAIPELPSAFEMWRATFDAIAPRMDSIGKLLLDRMKIEARTAKQPYVELHGVVPSAAAYDDLRQALNTIPGIAAVEPGTVKNFPDYATFSALRVVWPEREDI